MKIKVLNTEILNFVSKQLIVEHGVRVGDVYEVLDVRDNFYGIKTHLPNEGNETGLWYLHKNDIEKVEDIPSKFILINDTGLSLDKVNSCLNVLRSENGVDLDELDIVDELLVETLSHLQQLMDNLEKL